MSSLKQSKGSSKRKELSYSQSASTSAMRKAKRPKFEETTVVSSPTEVKYDKSLVLGWPADDVYHLISAIGEILPEKDQSKYTTSVEKLKWDLLAFKEYTADDCKDKWNEICDKQRKFRTLTDLYHDASEWIKTPWRAFNTNAKKLTRHPDLPKKPMTPFFLFFADKRTELANGNPDLSVTQISKLAAEHFRVLSDKKKKKYSKRYQEALELYKEATAQFKLAHPELELEKIFRVKPTIGPQKPATPFEMYKAEKLPAYIRMGISKQEGMASVQESWKALSDGKRIKWIRKAVLDENRFLVEVDEYKKIHFDYEANYKSNLTKEEVKLKDKYDKKPIAPPSSGYLLFAKENLHKRPEPLQKDKMRGVSEEWRNLSDETREEYKSRCVQGQARYAEKLQAFISKLPEEEREMMFKKSKLKIVSKKQLATLGPADVTLDMLKEDPKVTMKAITLFQKDKINEIQKKGDNVSDHIDGLMEAYENLPLLEKGPYLRAAHRDLGNIVLAGQKNVKSVRKQVKLPDHIKKKMPQPLPPRSAYALFNTEQLKALTKFESKDRMKEISRLWNEKVTTAEKNALKVRAENQRAKFDVQVQKFSKTLNGADREVYEAWLKTKSLLRKETNETNETDKTSKKKKTTQNEKIANDSEDEEEEDEEEKDNSDDEEGSEEDIGSEDSEDEEEEEVVVNSKKATKTPPPPRVEQSGSDSSSDDSSDDDSDDD